MNILLQILIAVLTGLSFTALLFGLGFAAFKFGEWMHDWQERRRMWRTDGSKEREQMRDKLG